MTSAWWPSLSIIAAATTSWPKTTPRMAGPRPSPTPASAPRSSTASPSTPPSSRPAPSPTASPAPGPAPPSRPPEPAMAGSPEPRSGDDTYDLIDDAVTALAGRRGTWLGDDIAAMALIASLIDQAERWLPQHVHDARANGHGWEQIAQIGRAHV